MYQKDEVVGIRLGRRNALEEVGRTNICNFMSQIGTQLDFRQLIFKVLFYLFLMATKRVKLTKNQH